ADENTLVAGGRAAQPGTQVDAPGHKAQRARIRFGKANIESAAGKLRVSERGVQSVNRDLGNDAIAMKNEQSDLGNIGRRCNIESRGYADVDLRAFAANGAHKHNVRLGLQPRNGTSGASAIGHNDF